MKNTFPYIVTETVKVNYSLSLEIKQFFLNKLIYLR